MNDNSTHPQVRLPGGALIPSGEAGPGLLQVVKAP